MTLKQVKNLPNDAIYEGIGTRQAKFGSIFLSRKGEYLITYKGNEQMIWKVN